MQPPHSPRRRGTRGEGNAGLGKPAGPTGIRASNPRCPAIPVPKRKAGFVKSLGLPGIGKPAGPSGLGAGAP